MVSTYRGVCPESPSAVRSFLITLFRLCSKSTNVPGAQSLCRILSIHDFSGLVEQHRQDAKKLGLQEYEHTILPQFARSAIHVEDAETKGATGPRFFLFPHCSTLHEGTIGSNH